MDLRVSVLLLFIFLTDSTGSCKAKVETCPVGYSKCARSVLEQTVGSSKVFFTSKVCADKCVPGIHQIAEGTLSLHCCDTDLCNAADEVFKGSFLLLFSPLLFYFLFQ